MEHFYFKQADEYPVCFLVKNIRADEINKHYIKPFGLDEDDVLVLSLYTDPNKKKTSIADQKQHIEDNIVEILNDYKVQYVVVCDGEYYKTFAKQTKPDSMVGYVVNTSPFGNWNTLYVPNYQAVFYDPDKVKAKINLSMSALIEHASEKYDDPGKDLPEKVTKLYSIQEIRDFLQKLRLIDRVSADIEAFSLKPHTAGIGTIGFGLSQEEAYAFPVDLHEKPHAIRRMLKRFFKEYQGNTIYHNISYDAMVLIFQLFMDDITDIDGLYEGMECVLRNWDDTKLISYLATNSCAGNKLGLKDQSQEFAGNYAVDVIDITKVPLPELLTYNGIDCLATWYVYNKNYPKMVADKQEDLYKTLFKDATLDIIQMQLTGLPVDMKQVLKVEKSLEAEHKAALEAVLANPLVRRYSDQKLQDIVDKKNAGYKKKRITTEDIDYELNLNSGPQLIELLYEFIGLPVIQTTKSKQPATGAKVLKILKDFTTEPEILELLTALIDYKAVDKVITSFIPAIKDAVPGRDGWHYLIGNFNLGGTVSGRLSSSDPNLQNLPAHGRIAKLIKSCFKAPPGWLFAGIDFASLEDRISALTTKDPNKLKVYTDGYDGHSLRAYSYFSEQLSHIPNTVAGINSIEIHFPELRQKGKAPTFAMTYQGTEHTLVKNCGFTLSEAQTIFQRFQGLYKVSIDYIKNKLNQACKDGYITVAFGLRVRTPLLAQTILGTRRTPHAASAEGRTAGNADGQSWCLLNSRAGSEVLKQVRASSTLRRNIRPCAQIHDAQYYLIKDEMETVSWANKALVNATLWQDHPDIYHPDVGLGGEFFICYPDWSKECKIPNNANDNEIQQACETHFYKLTG